MLRARGGVGYTLADYRITILPAYRLTRLAVSYFKPSKMSYLRDMFCSFTPPPYPADKRRPGGDSMPGHQRYACRSISRGQRSVRTYNICPQKHHPSTVLHCTALQGSAVQCSAVQCGNRRKQVRPHRPAHMVPAPSYVSTRVD